MYEPGGNLVVAAPLTWDVTAEYEGYIGTGGTIGDPVPHGYDPSQSAPLAFTVGS
jgi:hypothetical protein